MLYILFHFFSNIVTVKSTSTSRKVKRLCIYCDKLVFELSRHITNVHKAEVSHILDLPDDARNQKLNELKVQGIKKYNEKIASEKGNNKDLQRERKGNNSSMIDCSKCFKYISKSNMSKHKCVPHDDILQSTVPYLNGDVDSHFSDCILKLKCDNISDHIRRTDILRRIGKAHLDNIFVERKAKECKIRCRNLLRGLSKMHIELRQILDEAVPFTDMFYVANIEKLTQVIIKISEGTLSSKIHHFNSIKTASKILICLLAMDNKENESEVVKTFMSVSDSFWCSQKKK